MASRKQTIFTFSAATAALILWGYMIVAVYGFTALSVGFLALLVVGEMFLLHEIGRYAYRLNMKQSTDPGTQRILSAEADGWYADPFAFEEAVGRERRWEDGSWTEETRLHVPTPTN